MFLQACRIDARVPGDELGIRDLVCPSNRQARIARLNGIRRAILCRRVDSVGGRGVGGVGTAGRGQCLA